jgi:hypothetical protein
MYYKPKFCSNCGEKVERRDWKPWTSTRFCEVCESDLKMRDWLPRTVVFAGVLAGIFGFGSYLKTSEKPLNIVKDLQAANLSARQGGQPDDIDSGPRGFRTDASNSTSGNRTERGPEPAKPLALMEIQQNSLTEAVYFCGAKTKKGKPCSRLVKGGGRCWQHPGKAAMLAQEELLAPK